MDFFSNNLQYASSTNTGQVGSVYNVRVSLVIEFLQEWVQTTVFSQIRPEDIILFVGSSTEAIIRNY